MVEVSHSVDDVFGVSRDIPLNYVARQDVDEKLINNLSRRQHIVIHGGSKQGKTCLRKNVLADGDYVLVQCSNKWDIGDLHANILKRAGFELAQGRSVTHEGRQKASAKFSAKLLGVSVGVGGEQEKNVSETENMASLELDLNDANDVIDALKAIEFKRYIVLEDFHYLPPETQRDFAIALKAFHEASSLCFVIVGVWLEENRLIVANGDLTGRVVSVNVDIWKPEELSDVMRIGGQLLNVKFDESFERDLITASYFGVSVVQEACRTICRQEGIYSTVETLRTVGVGADAFHILAQVIESQGPRYRGFINAFADGFQKTELEMYRWILLPLLTAKPAQLEKGLLYREISEKLRKYHPHGKRLNLGNLTLALQSVSALQGKKDIKPLVIDYDMTRKRLTIVDRGFLVWQAIQDTKELLEEAGLLEHLQESQKGH